MGLLGAMLLPLPAVLQKDPEPTSKFQFQRLQLWALLTIAELGYPTQAPLITPGTPVSLILSLRPPGSRTPPSALT